MTTLDALRAARWARTGRDAAVYPLPTPSPMPDEERERIKAQGNKRIAYMRDYNAKRREQAKAARAAVDPARREAVHSEESRQSQVREWLERRYSPAGRRARDGGVRNAP